MTFTVALILKSSIIMLCATVLSLALRRTSASVRHAVWILGMAAALLVAVVPMLAPQLETRLVSILDARVQRRRLSRPALILSFVLTALLTVSIGVVGVTAGVSMPPVFLSTVSPPVPPAGPQRTRIGQTNSVSSIAVIPPRVIESSPPAYTSEAVSARIEGTVTLEANVDVQGNVSGLRLIKTLGYGLDSKAIEAVLAWKFAPATRDNRPVASVTQIDVDFRNPPPLRIGAGVEPPSVLIRVEPKYTPEAQEAKYRGTVVLEAIA
jgi:TonB family protein